MADGHIDQQLHLSGIRTELWPLEAGDSRDHIKPSNHTKIPVNPTKSDYIRLNPSKIQLKSQ